MKNLLIGLIVFFVIFSLIIDWISNNINHFIFFIIIIIGVWIYYYYFYREKNKNEDNIKVVLEYSESSGNYDNFEGWFYDEVSEYVPVKKTLKIKYKDGKNQVTKRVINVYKFGEASFGGFILAYRKLRDSNRTFRTDRIIECIDSDSGEYISNVSDYLIDEYHKTDEYKKIQKKIKKQEELEKSNKYYEDFLNKYNALIKVLVYIVKCDGTYSKREKAIVKEIFEVLENGNELVSDKMLEKVFKNYPMQSTHAFKINANKLITDNNFGIDIYTISKNIISTQSKIHPLEQGVLDYLLKKLNAENKNKNLKYDK